MEFTVLIHSAEGGGFWVEVPTLPGCFSPGETFEETMKNVREAIELYLEVLHSKLSLQKKSSRTYRGYDLYDLYDLSYSERKTVKRLKNTHRPHT